MNLLDIIKATLIDLDRGTADDTVAMYAEKFTKYANEAVNEIARRFKMNRMEPVVTNANPAPNGWAYFDSTELERDCKRVIAVYKGEWEDPEDPDSAVSMTKCDYEHPLKFTQPIPGIPMVAVSKVEPGSPIWVSYRFVPWPMSVDSLGPNDQGVVMPDNPELPIYMHELIPLYVRAREQCGQDPSLQGTSNAFFSMFNQAVYNLQRETLAVPDSFKFVGYHFE